MWRLLRIFSNKILSKRKKKKRRSTYIRGILLPLLRSVDSVWKIFWQGEESLLSDWTGPSRSPSFPSKYTMGMSESMKQRAGTWINHRAHVEFVLLTHVWTQAGIIGGGRQKSWTALNYVILIRNVQLLNMKTFSKGLEDLLHDHHSTDNCLLIAVIQHTKKKKKTI